jgi:hypothetical protein
LLKPQLCDAYPQSHKGKVLTHEIDIFHSNYWKKALKRSRGGFLGSLLILQDVFKDGLRFWMRLAALWFSGKFFIVVM